MRTVFKYPIHEATTKLNVPTLSHGEYVLPFKEQVLKVGVQRGVICVWVMVDDDKPTREVEINMFGTGHSCFDFLPKHYIGSALLRNENFVFHLFTKD